MFGLCERKTKMWWYCLTFFGLLVFMRPIKAGQRGNADSFVQHYNIMNCEPGVKTELNLKTGAAIFYYNETEKRNPLANKDFMCHYELETVSQYGFHVYIDEMYLSDEGPVREDPCLDFIQFARDRAFVTTYTSPKYCGHRSRGFTTRGHNGSRVTAGHGSRMYIEERDSEMDLFVKVSKRRITTRSRYIQMTVTVIKQNCGSKNAFYRQCPHTSHCIRREFFCDGRVNCAWPNAEAGGTDEINCHVEDGPYIGPFNTQGAANIPLVIVMIVIATAFIVVLLVFGKKFISIFCKANDLNRSTRSDSNELPAARTRRQPSTGPSAPTRPAEATVLLPDELDSSATRDPSTPPTAPPSYEDVIKDNPGVLSRGVPMAPPPYSESITMTQV